MNKQPTYKVGESVLVCEDIEVVIDKTDFIPSLNEYAYHFKVNNRPFFELEAALEPLPNMESNNTTL